MFMPTEWGVTLFKLIKTNYSRKNYLQWSITQIKKWQKSITSWITEIPEPFLFYHQIQFKHPVVCIKGPSIFLFQLGLISIYIHLLHIRLSVSFLVKRISKKKKSLLGRIIRTKICESHLETLWDHHDHSFWPSSHQEMEWVSGLIEIKVRDKVHFTNQNCCFSWGEC